MIDLLDKYILMAVDFVWGPVLVFLLFGGGVFLMLFSRGRTLKHFGLGFKLLFGFSDFGHSKDSEGQLSHFKALSNALAATVGLGNIAGVAVAVTQGGPGSIFWMWVSGIIGMNTKFFECTLSLLFRGRDVRGDVQGGPMYYIPKVLNNKLGVFLSFFFSAAGLIGVQAMFQTNQVASFLSAELSIAPIWIGLFFAIATGIILMGGLQRIATVTSAIVPTMCVIYVLSCLAIIFLNFEKVPEIFGLIFKEAFSFGAAFGGASGYAIMHAFKVGVKRGAFSNEAGTGTAPMAHGNAKTSEPVSEGLVAMIGPFIDTVIVCTLTALVILVSIDVSTLSGSIEGISLTAQAFEQNLGSVGKFLLGVSILFFGFSTMIGMANYNEKCWTFLFRDRGIFKRPLFIFTFCLMLFLGAIASVDLVVNLIDLGFGLMAYPNMIVVLIASPIVIKEIKNKLSFKN